MKLDILPHDGICGKWKIESFSVSEKEYQMTKIRALVNGRNEYVPPGDYKRLMRGSVVVMSNTPMEIATNMEFINRAKGRVLINGLGLGMVLSAILKKSDINQVTIIEKSPEVIKLVAPAFQENSKVSIIQADAFEYIPPEGENFDVVYHDIWDYICSDNLTEMRKLSLKYKNRSNWQGSWCQVECERLKRSRY